MRGVVISDFSPLDLLYLYREQVYGLIPIEGVVAVWKSPGFE